MKVIIVFLARGEITFINFLRTAIFLVMIWIGGLKAFQYEADGIVPFVANSPLMSFVYHDAKNYKKHINKEGQVVTENIRYHQQNGTYAFAHGLGIVITLIGLLTVLGIWFPKIGLWGGILTALMSLVTLSFLITTPEAYVPDIGGPNHGFPYLSGAGRLVIKDLIMLMAGLVVASDNARQLVDLRH